MSATNEGSLAQRMVEGRLPVPEALQLALSLAESLRKLHDAGKAHGAVTPSNIALTAAGLELVPSPGLPPLVTPYTAPEVLQGIPPDAQSDIFSFGALAFEMLTGLNLALSGVPSPSGSPALDRLVAGCVAKSPAARWQRMQTVIMELKLLTVAVRRPSSEIQQLEGHFATPPDANEYGALTQHLTTQVNETIAEVIQRLSSAERNMEEVRKHFAIFQAKIATDLHDFEQSLKRQSLIIDSACTAMAQTDDLVERVVETLELLQSSKNELSSVS
jgi:eukaryotic-like serine/threonine-protein kinase